MSSTTLRMNQAIALALSDAMAADHSVMVFGEDVAAAGGPFKTSDGLLEAYGANRVRDTPISEMAFTGAAVGAAMHGLRPVVEIMFMEFLGVALDQLVTQAATVRYLSQGSYTCPMVVRASIGTGTGFGCQHSQTLEGWLTGTPGLLVATPSDPQTAYGLMRSAIDHPDPVVVLEPRVLYGTRGPVDTSIAVPLGKGRLVSHGDDVTIVAMGRTVSVARDGATALAAEGIGCDVIDLLSLIPLDAELVLASVRRTRRLVIVEDAPATGGWGAMLVSRVSQEAFRDMVAAPARVTTPDVPVPYGKDLEARFAPDATDVANAVRGVVHDGQAPPPWWQSTDAEVAASTGNVGDR